MVLVHLHDVRAQSPDHVGARPRIDRRRVVRPRRPSAGHPGHPLRKHRLENKVHENQ